ncbi:MAG: hypothetical protein H6Q00_745 [Holophagaceae bacterium]|nr:hypothetical protein [Holophagaceae bacterium]
MARVNYQREKRLKDLERQRKQEEKRNRKLNKDGTPIEEIPQETQGIEGQETPAQPEEV